MPDATAIATALREELIAAGIVRHPADDHAPGLAPLIVEPRGGAPAPGDRDAPEDDPSLIVTLRLSGDMAETPLDRYRRRSVFDFYYRSKGTAGLQRGRAVDAAVRAHLTDRPDMGLGWEMGTAHPVFVLSSQMFGGLGRVADTAEGADELAKYMIEVHA